MDYKQHEATWTTFVSLVKWSIFILAMLMLSLYCFIEAGQVLGGVIFLVVGFATPLYAAFSRSMR